MYYTMHNWIKQVLKLKPSLNINANWYGAIRVRIKIKGKTPAKKETRTIRALKILNGLPKDSNIKRCIIKLEKELSDERENQKAVAVSAQ